ncbi:MAG: hypothetical protein B6244_13405 [Candidatus Cloacimonetes bacterium 4572_55]|nr:MAG: hypothetical protein B6244_13405 [Candidatus Cloacimonetes bacterium 4572_55]
MRRIQLFLATIFLIITVGTSFSQDQKFTIARVKYLGGGDWYSNPSSLPNLLKELTKRTNIDAADKEVRIKLTDDDLFNYPYLYLNGHGNIRFTDEEVERLRLYLSNGGFLHADDNYGMDKSFRREIKRVFPEEKFIDLPFSHEIYHIHYDFSAGPPKVHEHDGKPAQGLGLFHDGRLVVYYTYESDLGDGWEDPDVHNDPPDKREQALRMGINIIVYSLTH